MNMDEAINFNEATSDRLPKTPPDSSAAMEVTLMWMGETQNSGLGARVEGRCVESSNPALPVGTMMCETINGLTDTRWKGTSAKRKQWQLRSLVASLWGCDPSGPAPTEDGDWNKLIQRCVGPEQLAVGSRVRISCGSKTRSKSSPPDSPQYYVPKE